MRAGIALGPNPLGKDDPGQDFTAGRGGGGPSKLSGAEVEAMTQCIGSLMTQAWAGGQTDIFSVEIKMTFSLDNPPYWTVKDYFASRAVYQ